MSTFFKPNTEFNSYLAPRDFWAYPPTKRELRGKKFPSDQWSAARFRKVGWALWEVHRLPREILRKTDRHRTSIKFRLLSNESTNYSAMKMHTMPRKPREHTENTRYHKLICIIRYGTARSWKEII
jgi:hypothetical protein